MANEGNQRPEPVVHRDHDDTALGDETSRVVLAPRTEDETTAGDPHLDRMPVEFGGGDLFVGLFAGRTG
jgi:hypothetical protein